MTTNDVAAGRVVGGLYLAGTVCGVLGMVVGGPWLAALLGDGAPAATGAGGAAAAALLTLGMGLSLALMAIVLASVVREFSVVLAHGVLVFRGAIEGVHYLLSALLIATAAKLTDGAQLDLIVQVLRQVSPLGTIVFVAGAAFVYLALRAGRLVPRWLIWWGLAALVPYVGYAVLRLFDVAAPAWLQTPLGVQEIVMSVWLLARGFPTSRAGKQALDRETGPECGVS